MILAFHGGKCCGVKTIHGLGYHPGSEPGEEGWTEERFESPKLSNDKHGQHVQSDLSFFTDADPQESYLARFDRLLAFNDKERPYGVVEVTTTSSAGQTLRWKPFLVERGFKAVTECYNSNSGNRVTIWHRVRDKVAVPQTVSLRGS